LVRRAIAKTIGAGLYGDNNDVIFFNYKLKSKMKIKSIAWPKDRLTFAGFAAQ
jgi:hypothetical protein